MYSELECGICYRGYNAGRRCPRELQCKHSFCESCLLALSRPLRADESRPGDGRSIACPLCRHVTPISAEGRVRVELRVDDCALERLRAAAGALDREEDESEEEEEGHAQNRREDNEEATLPETPAEESDSLSGFRGGRLRLCLKSVWRKIGGKRSGRWAGDNCRMNNDDMRNIAMMSCYTF